MNTTTETPATEQNMPNITGNFVKFNPPPILRPNNSKSFKCNNGYYVTIEAYDIKRKETVHSGINEDEQERSVTETNYKIIVRKGNSNNPIERSEKKKYEDGEITIVHKALYETNIPAAVYNVDQLMVNISTDLEKHGVTLPTEKIIDFIRKDQERLRQEYPSNGVDKVYERYTLPKPPTLQ